jgi:NAD(P)-binding Rossmann-like domain
MAVSGSMAGMEITRSIEVDYLIVGAGAVGMAIADVLVHETDASIAIVDRHDRPGGHWNDAYPFVRLHGPSSMYGVNSRRLGSDRIDDRGFNKGLYELASRDELLNYFDQTMQQALLSSGRVEYFPMCNHDGKGEFTSLTSGERRRAMVRKKFVDTGSFDIGVPSTHPPSYEVSPDVQCVPPNALPLMAHPYSGYTVIGAGKTGIDACLWLLEKGISPERIRWIKPREAWLLNRANLQLRGHFFEASLRSMTEQLEAVLEARSVDDLFALLEARGQLMRVDGAETPTSYRCATVTLAELDQLRRIKNIVRLGRVEKVDLNDIVFGDGHIATGPDILHIDCSSDGLPSRPIRAIFDGDTITPQFVRRCQPCFSAAFIAHVEANYDDDTQKNLLCAVVPTPSVPRDWIKTFAITLANQYQWSNNPELDAWIAGSRLEGGLIAEMRSVREDDVEVLALLERRNNAIGPAAKKLGQLLGQSESLSPPSK